MQNRRAFTLIEILFVLLIILTMLGVSLALLNKNKKEEELKAEGEIIMALIREAQNNALAGKQVDVSGTQIPCKFGFEANKNNNKYLLFYQYRTTTDPCSVDFAQRRVNYIDSPLNNGVEFNADEIVAFSLPNGIFIGGVDKTIQLKSNGLVYNICVYISGRVEQC